MRKPVAGVALFAAVLAGATLPVGVAPAEAHHPNTVCSYWAPGDGAAQHVRADWMAGRSFRVTITDLTLLAAESGAGDTYVPLPLEPNLRLSTNTVTLDDGLAVSDVSISQGVEVSPAADGSPEQIDSYRKLPHAPWEAASQNGSEILWLHDIDARSDEAGNQSRPSSLASPAARTADAAGVLDFTITVPDNAAGEVWLVRGMSSESTGGSLSTDPEQWIPGTPSTRTLPGCSVTVEAAVAPEQSQAPSAKQAPAKQPDKTRGTGADTDSAAKDSAAKDKGAIPQRRSSRSEDHGGTSSNDPSAGPQPQPPTTGTDRHDPSAPDSSGEAVASSGGASAGAWLITAGAAVTLGAAVGIASLARARRRRDIQRTSH